MGKSKDLATGNSAAYVETAGDTMTGNLAITKSDASITPDADADDFVIEGNQAIGMTIGSSASSVGSIRFADSGSPRAGMLYYSHITDEMRLYTSANQRLTINSSGHVTMPSQPFIECTGDNNNTESFAANAVFNHWTDRTTPVGITRSGGRFTVPVAGNYLITYTLYTYVSAAGHYRIHLKKNGNVHMLNQLEISTGARSDSTYDHTVSASIILKMSANDYVEVVAADAMQIYEGNQHNALSMMLLG